VSSRESEDRAVQQTLLSSYTNPAIREARERQDALLVRLLAGGRFAIADVGCGDGYHAGMLREVCALYHGFEIAPEIARIARDRLRREDIAQGEIIEGDVREVPLTDSYDVVLCLYFTPGNMRTELPSLADYDDAYLDRNPGFIAVFTRFFASLRPGGRMFLTVYRDVPAAEAAQYDFYRNTGQEVVTAPGSRFVATAQHFWSVRFTTASMLSNLAGCGIAPSQVRFHELSDIAWLVEVTSGQ
jgi:SAM-dependent methyltransferase